MNESERMIEKEKSKWMPQKTKKNIFWIKSLHNQYFILFLELIVGGATKSKWWLIVPYHYVESATKNLQCRIIVVFYALWHYFRCMHTLPWVEYCVFTVVVVILSNAISMLILHSHTPNILAKLPFRIYDAPIYVWFWLYVTTRCQQSYAFLYSWKLFFEARTPNHYTTTETYCVTATTK